MSDALRINGNFFSYGSAILKVAGERYTGVTEVSYSDGRERTYGWGLGRSQAPRGMSRGKYSPGEFKFVMYRDAAQVLIDALAAQSSNGLSYGDVRFDAVIQWVEDDLPAQTVTILGCVITQVTESNTEGSDPMMTEFVAMAMRLYRNKKTLFDSSSNS